MEAVMSTPVPAYSAKTLLGELHTPEIFVVTLVRLRAAAQLDPASVPEDWRSGLRAAGVAPAGADAFDLLMHLLGTVLHVRLDIRSLRCGGLGEGEALLLQALSQLQHDRYEQAEQILGRWLPPGASRVAALQAQRFARALAAARLVIPLRRTESAPLDFWPRPSSDRGLALVH
jgi:hypothetical protein